MKTIQSYYPTSVFTRRYPDLNAARSGLDEATEAMCELLTALPVDALQRQVSPGKWSPGEVADHLVKANRLFRRAVSLASLPEPEAIVMPKGQMTDEGTAISPLAVEPRHGRPRAELVAELRRSSGEFVAAVGQAGEAGRLDAICLEHSFFGGLSAGECLQLAAWHTNRHLRALEKSGLE